MTETDQQEITPPDARADFSLENRIPQPPLPSQQSERLFWWCRVILWISPGPAWAIIGSGLASLGYHHFTIPLGIIIPIAFGTGYCDAFLSGSVRKTDGVPVLKEGLWHAFAFFILQIVIAPLTLLTLGLFLFIIYR